MRPPPIVAFLDSSFTLSLLCTPISRGVGRYYDDRKFCVTEDRTTVVQEVIDAEFDALPYNPSKRAEVVVYDIIEKELVVRLYIMLVDRS